MSKGPGPRSRSPERGNAMSMPHSRKPDTGNAFPASNDADQKTCQPENPPCQPVPSPRLADRLAPPATAAPRLACPLTTRRPPAVFLPPAPAPRRVRGKTRTPSAGGRARLQRVPVAFMAAVTQTPPSPSRLPPWPPAVAFDAASLKNYFLPHPTQYAGTPHHPGAFPETPR